PAAKRRPEPNCDGSITSSDGAPLSWMIMRCRIAIEPTVSADIWWGRQHQGGSMPPSRSTPTLGRATRTAAEVHAEFVTQLRFEALPGHAIEAAKLLVIDAAACAHASAATAIQSSISRLVEGAAAGPGSVFGSSRRVH